MANETKYNGWHNYETWNVKLWLGNDEGLYNLQREWAAQARSESDMEEIDDPMHREPVGILADMVKALIEEGAPVLEASMYSDLLNAAMSEVDWYEIAEHILEENPIES